MSIQDISKWEKEDGEEFQGVYLYRSSDRKLMGRSGPILIRDGHAFSINNLKRGRFEFRYELTKADHFKTHSLVPVTFERAWQ